jgi:predicted DNA-binding transcriptional regulator AlpA
MGREITSDEAAEIAGVARKTFSGYVARGQAPKPVRHIGRTPVWDEDDMRAWMNNRPGHGARDTARALERAAQRAETASSTDDVDDGSSATTAD